MRANISRLGTLFTAGFLLIALALGFWQVLAAERLNNTPFNPRLALAEQRDLRGSLLDRGGTILVASRFEGDRQVRDYPYPFAAPVTGYHSQRYGDSGLEERYDAQLRGTQAADLASQLERRLLHRRGRGLDVVATIDARIQRAAFESLDGRPGAIVVLDPRSGAILALVSSPTFAPGEIEERFPELRDDPGAPLLNRATQSAYVPGSVFKLVTAAAVVDKGLVDLDEPFSCTTALNLGGQPVDCRNSIHVPRLTLKQAFAWSSNRTFALAGLALAEPGPINRWLDDRPGARYPWADGDVSAAARELEEYARRFGFESELPFDLPVRPSRLKQPDSPWSVALLAATAFGQGELAVTPLQMAIVAATVANDGLVPRPYLVSALRDPAGREAPVHQPGGWLGRATSPETARILRDFMVEGVERGYASPARLQGVQVGGKTGTAETGPGQPPHAWFIGFAPADTPRVAIAVVVEHGGSGSEVAAPIAREVLRVALDVYRPG